MHKEHHISRPNFNPTPQTQTDLKCLESLFHNLDSHSIFSPDFRFPRSHNDWFLSTKISLVIRIHFTLQYVSLFFIFSYYSSSITQPSSCNYVFPLQFRSFNEAIRTQMGKYEGMMALLN